MNQFNRKIRIAGMDPSLRNWGLAFGTYDLDTKELLISEVSVAIPAIEKTKQVRQNSKDLSSALQLYEEAKSLVESAQVVFVEVPVGSQTARAMASYGICVGILGALRAEGFNFFQVTPEEVKLAGHGTKTASKKEMIEWAVKTHPEVHFPTYKSKGNVLLSEAQAEHIADAIGAIHAGIKLESFNQMLSFFK
jgi:Holliday junction resolvasome RuvABC endonuclease subunit